jgi:hypothetical protein
MLLTAMFRVVSVALLWRAAASDRAPLVPMSLSPRFRVTSVTFLARVAANDRSGAGAAWSADELPDELPGSGPAGATLS